MIILGELNKNCKEFFIILFNIFIFNQYIDINNINKVLIIIYIIIIIVI